MRHTLIVLAAFVVITAVAVVIQMLRPPAAPPAGPPPVRFTDVTAAAGLRFTHTNGATPRKFLPETMGGGVVVLDFDNDGWPDLFFPNGRPWPGEPGSLPTQALYRNNHDGTFADVTAVVGLNVTLYAMGAAAADVDGDGWTDLFVAAVGASKLFKNVAAPTGGRRFAEADAGVAGGAELPTPFDTHAQPIPFPASAAFLDYDGDGDQDLFVCRYLTWSPAGDLGIKAELPGGGRAYVPPTQFPAADNILYRNRGDGTFEDVSEAAGIRVRDAGQPAGKALGVTVFDADRDGWPDLVVACDTTRNLFFKNVAGPNGRGFEEAAMPAGLAYADGRPRGGMGIDAAYLTPDRLAVVVANFTNEPDTLFVSSAPGRFADTALAAGLAGPSRAPMKFGALFLDFDLDGRPDLLTCNGHLEPDIAAARPGETHAQSAQLFWNAGDTFTPIGPDHAGPDLFRPLVGRGCATLDYDGDGDLDIVLVACGGPARLLRNDVKTGNLMLRLDVPAGSEVTATGWGKERRVYATPARGYLSQSESVVTVGLGSGVLEKVAVRWPHPTGGTAEFTNPPLGGVSRLRPGKAAEKVR
ncbi:CRTAC1 family protein [bacterium]|nr:CRTAC1 family protein [bacterium]